MHIRIWLSGGLPNGGYGCSSGYMNYTAADDDDGKHLAAPLGLEVGVVHRRRRLPRGQSLLAGGAPELEPTAIEAMALRRAKECPRNESVDLAGAFESTPHVTQQFLVFCDLPSPVAWL